MDNKVSKAVHFLIDHALEWWISENNVRAQGGGKLDLGWLHEVVYYDVHTGIAKTIGGNELGANEAHGAS